MTKIGYFCLKNRSTFRVVFSKFDILKKHGKIWLISLQKPVIFTQKPAGFRDSAKREAFGA
jgi:hypothetical protein